MYLSVYQSIIFVSINHLCIYVSVYLSIICLCYVSICVSINHLCIYLIIIFVFICVSMYLSINLLCVYLCICVLSISGNVPGFLFLNCPTLDQWEPLQAGSSVLSTCPHHSLSPSLLSSTIADFSCTFSAPILESTISPRSLGPFMGTWHSEAKI